MTTGLSSASNPVRVLISLTLLIVSIHETTMGKDIDQPELNPLFREVRMVVEGRFLSYYSFNNFKIGSLLLGNQFNFSIKLSS